MTTDADLQQCDICSSLITVQQPVPGEACFICTECLTERKAVIPQDQPEPRPEPSGLLKFRCAFCDKLLRAKNVQKRVRILCPRCEGAFYLHADGAVELPEEPEDAVVLDEGQSPPGPKPGPDSSYERLPPSQPGGSRRIRIPASGSDSGAPRRETVRNMETDKTPSRDELQKKADETGESDGPMTVRRMPTDKMPPYEPPRTEETEGTTDERDEAAGLESRSQPARAAGSGVKFGSGKHQAEGGEPSDPSLSPDPSEYLFGSDAERELPDGGFHTDLVSDDDPAGPMAVVDEWLVSSSDGEGGVFSQHRDIEFEEGDEEEDDEDSSLMRAGEHESIGQRDRERPIVSTAGQSVFLVGVLLAFSLTVGALVLRAGEESIFHRLGEQVEDGVQRLLVRIGAEESS